MLCTCVCVWCTHVCVGVHVVYVGVSVCVWVLGGRGDVGVFVPVCWCMCIFVQVYMCV